MDNYRITLEMNIQANADLFVGDSAPYQVRGIANKVTNWWTFFNVQNQKIRPQDLSGDVHYTTYVIDAHRHSGLGAVLRRRVNVYERGPTLRQVPWGRGAILGPITPMEAWAAAKKIGMTTSGISLMGAGKELLRIYSLSGQLVLDKETNGRIYPIDEQLQTGIHSNRKNQIRGRKRTWRAMGPTEADALTDEEMDFLIKVDAVFHSHGRGWRVSDVWSHDPDDLELQATELGTTVEDMLAVIKENENERKTQRRDQAGTAGEGEEHREEDEEDSSDS